MLRQSEVDYIETDTGCWEWQLCRNEKGYGMGWDGTKLRLAHRINYERKHGSCPPELDHLCRNRACVNPDHLEPISHVENVRRGKRAKLTMEMAREIRASAETGVALAERYGVLPSTICEVRQGRTWKED